MRFKVKDLFLENLSYKVVSLFIALILWLTILGRRDFTGTRNVEVDVVVASQYVLQSQSSDHIKVKISGPRTALRRFMDSGSAQVLTLDLSNYNEGQYDVEVPLQKIDIPFGVKIVSVKPNHLQIKIGKRDP